MTDGAERAAMLVLRAYARNGSARRRAIRLSPGLRPGNAGVGGKGDREGGRYKTACNTP